MIFRINRKITKWIYIGILFILGGFFLKQGLEPWLIILDKWPVLTAVVGVNVIGIIIQAASFRESLLDKVFRPSFSTFTRIWAIGGITSFVAPVVAGLAVRTVLLQQEGINVKDSGVATFRQLRLSLEWALLVTSTILIFYPWQAMSFLGWLLMGIWICWILLKRWIRKGNLLAHEGRFSFVLNFLDPPRWMVLPLFWGQIFIMTLNYWLAFRAFEAHLLWYEAVLLSGLTILMSVAIIIPNGLGVLDGLWLWIASHKGMGMSESASLVLILRSSYLIAAGIIWVFLDLCTRKNVSVE